MTPRLLAAAATLPFFLLAGCGDGAEEAVPAEAPSSADAASDQAVEAQAAAEPEVPSLRATVSDVLGSFESEVFGIALWEHPELSFASAVLAANGEAGLAVVPVDKEVEGSTVEGTFDGPIAVGYTQEASYLAAASEGRVALHTIDADRTVERIGELAADPAALCMVGDVLLTVGAEATAYRVAADGTSEEVFSKPADEGADCAATNERFFLSGADGSIASFGPDGEDERAVGEQGGGAASSLGALSTPGGAALVFLDEGALTVGGPDTAPVPVEIVRGGDPVEAVRGLAAGSGNYGSVYRDGVIAMLTGERELVLLPWAGVARAAGLGGATSTSLRPGVPSAPRPSLEPELPALPSGAGPDGDE